MFFFVLTCDSVYVGGFLKKISLAKLNVEEIF